MPVTSSGDQIGLIEEKTAWLYDTETLDRLYLEWSQFTRARTARELNLQHENDGLHKEISRLIDLHEKDLKERAAAIEHWKTVSECGQASNKALVEERDAALRFIRSLNLPDLPDDVHVCHLGDPADTSNPRGSG